MWLWTGCTEVDRIETLEPVRVAPKSIMKNRIKITIVLGALAVLAAIAPSSTLAGRFDEWRRDAECGRRLPNLLHPTTRQGCDAAYCTEVPPDPRICACLSEKEPTGIQILFEYPSGVIKKPWITNEVSYVYFVTESFRLDAVDLNGDGKDELLFGAMSSQSNGIGIEYWTVWAIDEGQASDPIEVQDYGTMSFATRPHSSRSCQLLVSRWINGWESSQGPGKYIVGRWYQFSKGEGRSGGFFPRFDRPAVYQRYRFSLQQLRSEANESGKPLLWYASKKTLPVVGPYPLE